MRAEVRGSGGTQSQARKKLPRGAAQAETEERRAGTVVGLLWARG